MKFLAKQSLLQWKDFLEYNKNNVKIHREIGESFRKIIKNAGDLFLSEELREHFNNDMFYGFDMDRTMLRIGAMNMLLHGVDNQKL